MDCWNVPHENVTSRQTPSQETNIAQCMVHDIDSCLLTHNKTKSAHSGDRTHARTQLVTHRTRYCPPRWSSAFERVPSFAATLASLSKASSSQNVADLGSAVHSEARTPTDPQNPHSSMTFNVKVETSVLSSWIGKVVYPLNFHFSGNFTA